MDGKRAAAVSARETTFEREQELISHYDETLEYYSPVNSKTAQFVLDAMKVHTYAVRTALDLGCGDGRFSIWLSARNDALVRGVDYSAKRIELAVSKASVAGVSCEFVCEDLHRYLAADSGQYDLITLFEVLEHLEDPVGVLADARFRLSPGGCMIGSVPLNDPYHSHLHIFYGVQDVIQRLKPDLVASGRKHVFCRWNAPVS